MRIISSLAAAAIALSTASYSVPASAGGGDALLGGAVGFVAGTIFGNATARPAPPRHYPGTVYVTPPPPPPPVVVYSAVPQPWTPDWYAYCARKFVSFDARSGTYLGTDGFRHMCH